MTAGPDRIEAYVEAAAPLAGLVLNPACRPGIVANFARIAAFAALVTEFDLPDEAEPAPVFAP